MTWKLRSSNSGRVKRFFSSPDIQINRLWSPHGLLFTDYWCYFPGINRPGREISHLPPSSGEVKNECGFMRSWL